MKTPNFIDRTSFTVRAGRGGDGCTSFQQESHKPRGGPDGGNGGAGGDVVLKADEGLTTLAELTYSDVIEAGDGGSGGPKKQRGQDGDDRVVRVPLGTVVYRRDTGEKLGELREEDDELIVAEGGGGGRGNNCFVSSQRQAPLFHEYGASGEEIPLRLELKLIADVGLIGAPNAGKSTLLSALTAANPKIASHSFTTQSPNLGALFRDHEQITLCDIPGLIEDAHRGAGLGVDFLRHVERTRLLVHVVDLSGTRPLETYRTILKELEEYGSGVVDKPQILALNKVDLVDWGVYDVFLDEITPPGPVVLVSALEGTGLKTLRDVIWSLQEVLGENEQEEGDEYDRVVKMKQRSPIKVQEIGDRFILQGEKVEELVRRFDLHNSEAQSYVRQQLLSEGVHKKLEAAGCEPGDTIQVNDQLFHYTG